jgi:Rrf2 family nitric oxide-sensitive transcriptional repressor
MQLIQERKLVNGVQVFLWSEIDETRRHSIRIPDRSANMHLTSFSDYSLRVLLFVGAHPERLVTVPEIASAYGISQNHLVKVVGRLAELGVLETVRGRGGGLRLAVAADELRIGQLLRKIEPSLVLVECFDPATNTCVIASACGLKGALRDAQQQFLATLDQYTLASILGKAPKLRALWEAQTRESDA